MTGLPPQNQGVTAVKWSAVARPKMLCWICFSPQHVGLILKGRWNRFSFAARNLPSPPQESPCYRGFFAILIIAF